MNYWMFRVSSKWGYRIGRCLEEGFVQCGWSEADLVNGSHDEIRQALPWASSRAKTMAIKFTYINPGDVIIMPVIGGVAIGIAGEKERREDLDWKNTIKVDWKARFYPRRDLSSNLQSSLKYRGTFLNLWRYAEELQDLINRGFEEHQTTYDKIQAKLSAEQLETISAHLAARNLNFQDTEFEDFVLHLLELAYPVLTGDKNNQRQEAKDGKDLTMSIDLDDFELNIQFNVQIKQHGGWEGTASLRQISKSDASDPYVKNVVVTSAHLPESTVIEAEKEGITLIGAQNLAAMIIDNFDQIDEKYKAKLNLLSSVQIASEIDNS